MAKSFSNKEWKILLKSFEEQGCRISPLPSAAGGWKILPPTGAKPIILHGSNSDSRALKNIRAEVKRQNLTWPLS